MTRCLFNLLDDPVNLFMLLLESGYAVLLATILSHVLLQFGVLVNID